MQCGRRIIKAFILLELEESKGGKGRDSGECDPLFEDGEGDREGSGGQQATDTNPPQPGGL